MLGFAVLDRRPASETTAVWSVSRSGDNLVRNTNAVVLRQDDPEFGAKIHALTADRSVVLTDGSEAPIAFAHAVGIEVFDDLVRRTASLQERIGAAVAEYAGRKRVSLVAPRFLPVPALAAPVEDEPRYRALAAADYIGLVWAAWLFTEDQRARRTVSPRTQETPWIMPDELNSPVVAALPAEFADRVKPEPRA